MSSPLYERIGDYARRNRISFAMPGHKGGAGLKKDLLSLDVTELDGTEDLHHGGEYVTEARRLLSRLYGSGDSYILTGGSTAAVQSMICGAVAPGGLLLASADCHQSVVNACAVMGIRIRFIPTLFDKDFCIPRGVSSVAEYITDDTDAVMLVSPNYYGICSDIKTAARECHARHIPLLVDEAHGAHFAASALFPETAVKYADAVCHSAHKTLNALTGAAYLHINGALIDTQRTRAALSVFQSSSPSYVIASSADTAREDIEDARAWEENYARCAVLRKNLSELGADMPDNDDMTRVVFGLPRIGMTGFELNAALSERGIDTEMADLYSVVTIITPSNTQDEVDALRFAVADIAVGTEKKPPLPHIDAPPICGKTLDPSAAFFAEREQVKLSDASGRVSCVNVAPYPPGIPIITIGETVTDEKLDYIKHILGYGGAVTGVDNGEITVTGTKK